MYGLEMVKEYLDEILDGKKNNDVRMFDTNIKGRIALIDTKKSTINGFITITGTHQISCDEYIEWHKTGKWENAEFYAERNKRYYSYDFADPEKLAVPIKVSKTSRIWCVLDDNEINDKIYEQLRLF